MRNLHQILLGKTYLGHVPINRSHQMNNHFLSPEVTTCEINTQIFRKHDIFLFNVTNNKKLKKKSWSAQLGHKPYTIHWSCFFGYWCLVIEKCPQHFLPKNQPILQGSITPVWNMTPPKQSCQKMHITLKKILCWNINHHALTMCVPYHHEVHFYENFKRCQKCTKWHNSI